MQTHGSCRTVVILVTMVIVHCVLLLHSAWQHSPVHAEVQQLPAGLYHLKYGRFDFADVNPPLVRLVGGFAASAMAPMVEYDRHRFFESTRPEYEIGRQFIAANASHCQSIFFAARVACIPFSLLGGVFCWLWSKSLYGDGAGLLAGALWCFSPSILAHGSLVSADLAATSLGLVASYGVWRWLRAHTWRAAVIAGVGLGFAALTKLTLLILFPLTVVWIVLFSAERHNFISDRHQFLKSIIGYLCQFAVVLVISVYVLDAVYLFDGVPFRPADETYSSSFLKPLSRPHDQAYHEAERSRLRDSLWLPLPKSYVRGLDRQKVDFESNARSFLHGEWKTGGWWYYYLYAFGVKTPLGTLALGLLATATLVLRKYAAQKSVTWIDEAIPFSLMLGTLILVSSQVTMSAHMRYALPVMGLLFVFASRSAVLVRRGQPWAAPIIVGCVAWSGVSGIAQYPHALGYFNELVGPSRGHLFLNHSNVDWGQDLYYLKEWWQHHPEARPFYLSPVALYSPRSLGIGYSVPYRLTTTNNATSVYGADQTAGPRPGWYAISKNDLIMPDAEYDYFSGRREVATAGSAINIYRLSLADVNEIRAQYSLPLLPDDWEQQRECGKRVQRKIVEDFVSSLTVDGAHESSWRIATLYFDSSPDSTDVEERNICRDLSEAMGGDCHLISVADVNSGILSAEDVLLVPGGSSELMAKALGGTGRDAIRSFVRRGGGYIGICAGSFLATDRFEFSLNVVDAAFLASRCDGPGTVLLRLANRDDNLVKIDLTDSGRRLFGGARCTFSASYTGGPIFQDEVLDKVASYATLATYGSELPRCEKERGMMIGAPAIIAATFGKGRVMLFGFHPESDAEAKELLSSAVRAVAPSPFLAER